MMIDQRQKNRQGQFQAEEVARDEGHYLRESNQ